MTQSAPNGLAAAVTSDYITAIDHVGVAVADLDTAVAWYSANLGMVEIHREVNESQGVHEAMLSLAGAPSDATLLQVLAPLDENSTIAKFINRSGPGLQQLAYRVSDLDALSVELRDRGVRLLYDGPGRGTADSRINFIHPKDSGGVLVELIEPAAESAH